MKFVKLIVMIFVLSSFVFLVSAVAFDNTVEATQETGTGHVAGETGHGDDHADSESHGHGHINLGEVLPLWSCIPFACMLLSIALFPLLAPQFWHHHFGKVSAFWSVTLGLPFLIAYKGAAMYEILHIVLADYVPFIILLWALFSS